MDFSTLFGGLLFSAVGFAGVQIGRRRQSPAKIGIGIMLMVLPFLLGGVPLWLAGALGVAGLWFLP